MSDTLITIIAIFLAAILMFIVPLMSVAERNDDIAQSVAQAATSEFTSTISTVGAIKESDYDAYVQRLGATGNTYDVEIEVQHFDENPGKKAAITSGSLIGENLRYSTFTSEILDTIENDDDGVKSYPLKKGDNVIVTAKNTNKTIAQSLRSFMYKIIGKGTYQIGASSSSMVINTGK